MRTEALGDVLPEQVDALPDGRQNPQPLLHLRRHQKGSERPKKLPFLQVAFLLLHVSAALCHLHVMVVASLHVRLVPGQFRIAGLRYDDPAAVRCSRCLVARTSADNGPALGQVGAGVCVAGCRTTHTASAVWEIVLRRRGGVTFSFQPRAFLPLNRDGFTPAQDISSSSSSSSSSPSPSGLPVCTASPTICSGRTAPATGGRGNSEPSGGQVKISRLRGWKVPCVSSGRQLLLLAAGGLEESRAVEGTVADGAEVASGESRVHFLTQQL